MFRKGIPYLFLLILTQIGALQVQATTIKAVVFDFGGVVATVDRTVLVQFLMGSFPISEEEANMLLKKWGRDLRQEGDEEQFWTSYADSLNVKLPTGWLAQFHAAQACALRPFPQTLEAVKKLQEQGYQTAMLSNVTKQHAAIIRKLGYYNLFEPALLSYAIGVRKPDPQAYRLLLEQLSLPPSEVLFIDDQNANVVAAEKLGIQGIHFIHPELLEQELLKHGIRLAYPEKPY